MKVSIREKIFIVLTMLLMAIYIGWRLLFTLPLDESLFEIIFGILLLLFETITVLTTFELIYHKFNTKNIKLEMPIVDKELYPDVDVFIATHNEACDLLYKTVNACNHLEYPNKNKVHIYLCDDTNRIEVQNLAKELNVGYLAVQDNKHAKSGNYNYSLSMTNSPLVATFDADMIPQSNFLMETVPYFFIPYYIKDKDTNTWRKRTEEEYDKNYKFGLVQTPQSFYNHDLFQFNLYSEQEIPNEQDFFSREINILRNASNACAYTGSGTVILREALEEINGFPIHTITEDYELSIRLQKAKYRTYATDKVVNAGLTTTDFKSMIKQRQRWARGVIQSIYNTRAFCTTKYSLGANISYLTSYLYWWSFLGRIIFILAPILFALFDLNFVNCTLLELLIFWLPSYLCYTFLFRYLSSGLRLNRWSQIIDTILAPYLIKCVLLESILIRHKKFVVTSKENKETNDLKYAIPHIILIVMSVLALIRFTYGKYGWQLIYGSVIIFWLCFNLVSLLYALIFMHGRKTNRSQIRINAKEDILIKTTNGTCKLSTVDMSDNGILIESDKPRYFPENKEIEINIYNNKYNATLLGTIISEQLKDNKWLYTFTINPKTNKDKNNYFQIIYDRTHNLPTVTDSWSSIADDFRRNIYLRLKSNDIRKRKLTRTKINELILFDEGVYANVYDCSYKYLSIATNQDNLTMSIPNNIKLKLVNTGIYNKENNAYIYEINNLDILSKEKIDYSELIHILRSKCAI